MALYNLRNTVGAKRRKLTPVFHVGQLVVLDTKERLERERGSQQDGVIREGFLQGHHK